MARGGWIKQGSWGRNEMQTNCFYLSDLKLLSEIFYCWDTCGLSCSSKWWEPAAFHILPLPSVTTVPHLKKITFNNIFTLNVYILQHDLIHDLRQRYSEIASPLSMIGSKLSSGTQVVFWPEHTAMEEAGLSYCPTHDQTEHFHMQYIHHSKHFLCFSHSLLQWQLRSCNQKWFWKL